MQQTLRKFVAIDSADRPVILSAL